MTIQIRKLALGLLSTFLLLGYAQNRPAPRHPAERDPCRKLPARRHPQPRRAAF